MYQVRYVTEDTLKNGDTCTMYWGNAFNFMRQKAKERMKGDAVTSILMKRQELNGDRWMTTMTYPELS